VVDANALKGHLRHGDSLGACNGNRKHKD
jgi:hypothetical protein